MLFVLQQNMNALYSHEREATMPYRTCTPQKESLNEYLSRRISEIDQVPVSQVTNDYIQEKWEAEIEPDTRFDICSEYGGYQTTGLAVLTRREIDELTASADRLAEKR